MSDDGVTIRKATLDDVPALVLHRRRMFEDMGHDDARALDDLDRCAEAFFSRALAEGTYAAWLAVDRGKVVGGGGVILVPWPGHPDDPLPRRAWILNVYTDPAVRRRGLARRVMATIIEWCRSEGLPFVSLHSSRDGRRLYEGLGFRATNEMRLSLGGR